MQAILIDAPLEFAAYAANSKMISVSPIEASPTEHVYDSLDYAFTVFNERLFEPLLGIRVPPCVITLSSQRRAFGYFHGAQFVTHDGRQFADLIALNPRRFHATPSEVLSTLGHEMMHGAQQHYGKPSGRHHNRQFSQWMARIGLTTSDTGKPGGNPTGRNMSEYVTPGGPFEILCAELLADGWGIDWAAVEAPEQPPKPLKNKVAYSCDRCGIVLWGEPKHHSIGVRPSCQHCR
jgi:hypothetical protein